MNTPRLQGRGLLYRISPGENEETHEEPQSEFQKTRPSLILKKKQNLYAD
jgi:hypothetical protein